MSEYKLVPVEPTDEMIGAARELHEGAAYLPVSVYKAMLAAAPAVQGEPVASGWMLFPKEAWDFLCGTGELNGFGFGDRTRAQPPFWWRLVIRKMLDSAPQSAPSASTFQLGDHVRKTKGSQWKGRVVGTYRTELTPEGYAVESDTEKGSVQIYPAAALEMVGGDAAPQSVTDEIPARTTFGGTQRFTTAEQHPAEQHPTVAQLAEALEQVIKAAPSGGPLWHGSEQIVEARAALAAHRKQGGEA